MNKLQKMVKKLDVFLFDGFYQQLTEWNQSLNCYKFDPKNVDFSRQNTYYVQNNKIITLRDGL